MRLLLIILSSFFLMTAHAENMSYEVLTINIPEAYKVNVFGINDKGQIFGKYKDYDQGEFIFISEQEDIIEIIPETNDCIQCECCKHIECKTHTLDPIYLSNNGLLVGLKDNNFPFLYDLDGAKILTEINFNLFRLNEIANIEKMTKDGTVIGQFNFYFDQEQKRFFWKNGNFYYFGNQIIKELVGTYGIGIFDDMSFNSFNNQLQCVGLFRINGSYKFFFWDGNKLEIIETPKGYSMHIEITMNENGIVMLNGNNGFYDHTFLWSKEKGFFKIIKNFKGRCINNSLTIIGWDSQNHTECLWKDDEIYTAKEIFAYTGLKAEKVYLMAVNNKDQMNLS